MTTPPRGTPETTSKHGSAENKIKRTQVKDFIEILTATSNHCSDEAK